MRLRPSELLRQLNSSYWFVPLVLTLGGIALAVGLLLLDSMIALDSNSTLAILRPSSAEGARALLSAIIGAMITAISVTFSVTIVALTVAAQHFGARVLNNFVRHTAAQAVLGTFLATFAYSVLALGAIRGTGATADVPELTVSGTVVLVIISIGALIYYVHHVSTTLQIGHLAAEIAADIRGAVARLNPTGPGAGSNEPAAIPEVPADAVATAGLNSGYVQRIDYGGILRLATDGHVTVWIRCVPGMFVIAGTPLALIHPPDACDDRLRDGLRRAFLIGTDRTFWHDPEFAVNQLVEIALRALSPGVNEPFTALTCIDRLAEGLACAATTPCPQSVWRDHAGEPRLFVQAQQFAALLRAAFSPIRIYAGSNPAIYVRLLDRLAELGMLVRDPDRTVISQQTDLIVRAARRTLIEADDRAYVESRHRHTQEQLARVRH